jgi:stearoyl-CoA desaturase (delta-9 desaturase)
VSGLLLALLVGFAISQLTTFATTIYLHRALAHRALNLSPPLTAVCRTIIWLTSGMKPREWAAVHRRHHAFTDQEADPHSPLRLGWVRVQLTNALLYRQAARDGVTVPRYARDIPADRWDRWLFDRAWLGFGITFALLILGLGLVWGVVAGVWYIVAYLALSGAINAVAHTFGRRPHDNSATNLQWLAWITGGEGLHNNHHAAPTAARFSFRRGEFDPTWPIIRLLARMRQVTVRHPGGIPTREPARAG